MAAAARRAGGAPGASPLCAPGRAGARDPRPPCAPPPPPTPRASLEYLCARHLTLTSACRGRRGSPGSRHTEAWSACVDAVSVGPPAEGAVGRGPCVGRARSRAGSPGAGERDPCRFPCVQILLVSRVVCCDTFTHGCKPNLGILLSWFTVRWVLSYEKKESLAFPVGVCSFCF